ncbi:MAG TPA: alkaline phosphatase family protein, partial [Candidatus Tumulicola sp.]
MRARIHPVRLASIALVATLAACSNQVALPSSSTASVRALQANVRPRATGKIQHVIIVIQENRSVDNLFQGLPGADTRSYGFTTSGEKVMLRPIGLAAPWDIDHSSTSFFQACNGAGSYPGTRCRMNGFDHESLECGGLGGGPCPKDHPQYGYVPRKEAQPYFDMAAQWAFGDRMFTSHFDASSFVSHQYIIAGQAQSSVDYPTGLWGCDGGKTDTVGTVNLQR